mmetsp:Transcript_29881/g.75171  ORF Transcript_29881/g.75171 Transcript_29881/m.75171 type:complete len:226 (+) Transcript_29881:2147-2824(+)
MHVAIVWRFGVEETANHNLQRQRVEQDLHVLDAQRGCAVRPPQRQQRVLRRHRDANLPDELGQAVFGGLGRLDRLRVRCVHRLHARIHPALKVPSRVSRDPRDSGGARVACGYVQPVELPLHRVRHLLDLIADRDAALAERHAALVSCRQSMTWAHLADAVGQGEAARACDGAPGRGSTGDQGGRQAEARNLGLNIARRRLCVGGVRRRERALGLGLVLHRNLHA